MSLEKVRIYLDRWNRGKDIIDLADSIATVELAARVLGVEPARIAKSISLRGSDTDALMVVASGDMKLDNRKFRDQFGFKPRMLSHGEALQFTGHAVGGVCPFALCESMKVYLDNSLKRFTTVFPACGSDYAAIELTPSELEEYAQSIMWVDVCLPKL